MLHKLIKRNYTNSNEKSNMFGTLYLSTIGISMITGGIYGLSE